MHEAGLEDERTIPLLSVPKLKHSESRNKFQTLMIKEN
jgi:hypothetical protein